MSARWADSSTVLLGVHHPGSSVLHRTPAAVKLVGVAVVVGIVLWWRHPAVVAAGVLLAVLMLVATGVPARKIARPLSIIAIFLSMVGLAQWFLLGPASALIGVGRVAACVLTAWAVSLTTPASEMLALFVGALRPLRPLGVNPDRVGLTVMLAIRSIPLVLSAVRGADEARAARGARRSVRALVVPSVVRTVRIADLVGDALVARSAAIDSAEEPARRDSGDADPEHRSRRGGAA